MKLQQAIALVAVALASCGPERQPPQPTKNANSPLLPAPSAPPAVTNNSTPSVVENKPSAASVETNRGAPLAEPTGSIDPKSAEAAGQVVQHYGALIEQKRFDEAGRLWGDSNDAANFRLQLRRYAAVHLAVGKPEDMQGAAGSIYITVPAAFYGTDQNGTEFRRSAEVVLRRVNDVPGSTEQQRRWHIQRIDWKNSR